MNNFTYGHYLVEAMKELSPPNYWCQILARALNNINCNWRRKYNEQQLRKALDVGLRFGIIREFNKKYYLYEYGCIRSTGEIEYDFEQNPLEPEETERKSEVQVEKLMFPMKRKCEDNGLPLLKRPKLC